MKLEEPIAKHLAADFIRQNSELLSQIPGFFSHECPIKSVGLNIHLKKKGVIEILPEYEWVDDKEGKKAEFYDEFVFMQGKGFYRLPLNLRPLHYLKEIKSQDHALWDAFFLEQLPRLKNELVCKVDPRLDSLILCNSL